MEAFFEYIALNYTWLLGAAIIILLAIIGSYADKTNFGQGKENEKKELNDSYLNEKTIEDVADKKINEPEGKLKVNHDVNLDSKAVDNKTDERVLDNEITKNTNNSNNANEVTGNNKSLKESNEKEMSVPVKEQVNSKIYNAEEKFEKFDKEFSEIIPKKELIDEQLLDEIDNLSLEKTQKFKFSDIPDLDDIELPKIKPLKSNNEDVWKF